MGLAVKNPLIAVVTLNLLIVLLPNSFANLPDEINFKPYQQIYQNKKAISDQLNNVFEQNKAYRIELESGLAQNQAYLSAITQERLSLIDRNNQLDHYIAEVEQYMHNLRSRISGLNNEINQQNRNLQNLDRNISQVENDLRIAEQRFNQMGRDFQQIENEVARRLQQKRDADRDLSLKVNQRNTQINHLNKAKSDLTARENRHRDDQAKLSGLQREISNRQQLLSSKQSELNTLNSNLTQLRSQLNQASSQVNSLRSEQKKLIDQKSGLMTDKRRLEGQLRNLPDTPENQARRAEIRRNLTQVDNQISALDRQINHLNQQIAQATTELKRIETQVSQAQTRVNQAQTQLNTINSQLSQARSELSRVQASMNSYQTDRNRLLTQITNFETTISRLNREIQQAESLARNLDQRYQESINRRNQIRNQLEVARREVEMISSQRQNLLSQRNHLRQNISSLNNDLNNSTRELNQQQQNLVNSRTEINQNTERIGVIIREIPQVNSTIAQFESALIEARSEEQLSFQTWQTALVETKQAFEAFNQREKLFQNYLTLAKQIGVNEAKIAHDVATSDSLQLMTSNATQLSLAHAQLASVVDAKYRAYVRAEIKGYYQGHETGLVHTESIQAGQRAGDQAALVLATNQAENTHRPQYRQKIFTQLLQSTKIEKIIANNIVQNIELYQINSENNKLTSQASSDLSEVELEESDLLETELDSEISKLSLQNKSNLEKLALLKKPETSYKKPQEIKLPAHPMSCRNQVYKNLKIFTDACAESFGNNYEKNYFATHAKYYQQGFTSDFTVRYEEHFLRLRSVSYSNHFEQAYAVAFTFAEVIGRTEARDLAYNQTYQAKLPIYTQNQIARVEAEEQILLTQHIENNAIIILRDEKIKLNALKGGNFKPNSQFSLDILVRNIGKAINRPDQVLVEIDSISKNIKSNRVAYLLSEIDAQSSAVAKEAFIFDVLNNAVIGDEINVKLKFTINDGAHYAQRVITVEAKAKVGLDFSVDSESRFESEPKFRKTIIPLVAYIYPTHSIGIKLAPKYRGLVKGYSVKLDYDSKQIKFENDSAMTRILDQNQLEILNFNYKFRKGAKRKTVKVMVNISYDAHLVQSGLIELSPR